jgi:ribosome-associated translation inhibitor RaiA
VDLGLPELTSEQIETVCATAEDAARKFIFSKVNQKQVDKLNISVEAEGDKPISFTVEVDLQLAPEVQGLDQKELADEAVEQAFEAIEASLRKLT